MKTKLTFLIIAAALAAATAGRAQTVISYSTDGGAQALETGSVRQTVLDTATLEVSYRMEWLRRPDSKEPMQDLLLLQAGGKVTKFFSYKTLQRDSLLRITPTEQVLANVGNFKGGPGGRRIPELPRRRDDLHRQDLTGQHALHRAAARNRVDAPRRDARGHRLRLPAASAGAITKPGTPRSSRSPPAPGNSTDCPD